MEAIVKKAKRVKEIDDRDDRDRYKSRVSKDDISDDDLPYFIRNLSEMTELN